MPAFKNEDVPLNLKYDTYHDPVSGISQSIPMLDPKWIELEEVEFISYVSPPIQVNLLTQTSTPCDQYELQAWEERGNFIMNDLKWLLCQSHRRFWNQVIFNKSINMCLDSYLKLSPRSFDVWKFLPEEILKLQNQIHRSVFMVYLRISTHKESKEDFFTPSIFGEILYENFLFDIPKIMDMCALYGGEESENKSLLTKMLDNVFSKQPKYVDDLYQMIPSIFQSFEIIEIEVGVSYDDGAGPKKLEKERGLKITHDDDIVLYLFDIFQTLLSLLQTLPILCQHFFKVGLLQRLLSFYEEVMPLLRQKYCTTSSTRSYLKRCKADLINLSHLIMNVYCLEPLEKSNNEVGKETKENCIESFLSVLMEMLSFKRFLRMYNSNHSIMKDINNIQLSGIPFDETRIQYILSAVGSLEESTAAKLRQRSKKKNSSKKIEYSQALSKQQPSNQVPTVTRKKVDDEELHSMISHVNDLFPHCDEGFIITCLQQLNYDVEKTINLILEDDSPPQLEKLDPHLPDVVASSSGILATRHSVYDEDEFDVFSKENVDLSRVHKGKSHVTEDTRTVLDDKKDVESFRDVILNYDESFNDYNDEYDDTYDTHDVGAQDVDSADELSEMTMRRPFTTPRVLRNLKDSSDEEEKSSQSQENSSTKTTDAERTHANSEKDNSAQRNVQAGHGATGKQNYRSSKNVAGDRSYKDKNKAKFANHNRKAGAAKKQARGMAF